MRPPSAMFPGYFSPVTPLPNGNQYGTGFPYNPFAGTAPARPTIEFGNKPGPINRAPDPMPVLQNIKSEVAKSGDWSQKFPDPTPQIQIRSTANRQTPLNTNGQDITSRVNNINVSGNLDAPIPAVRATANGQTPLNTNGQDLASHVGSLDPITLTPLAQVVSTANGQTLLNPNGQDVASHVGSIDPTTLTTPSLMQMKGIAPTGLVQAFPVAPAPTPTMPIRGAGGPTLSDEKTKKDKKILSPKSGNGLYDASNMLGQYLGGLGRKSPENPEDPNVDYGPHNGWGSAQNVQAWGINRDPRSQGQPAMSVGEYQAGPQAQPVQASFEGGPNPMMGLGVPVPPPQAAPPQPFGQEPNMPQQTVNPDWNRFVSSPVEAKKDIQPAGQDPWKEAATYWRPVVDATLAEPQSQFPSMSGAPIVPGRAGTGPAAFGTPPVPGRAPEVDLRPAKGYSYNYKDPNMPGAKEGRQYGPMAQDLELTAPGASVVDIDPRTGMKSVDTNRLTMVNTAAISEQQRKMDELTALLDFANERAGKDTGSRKGRF